MPNKLGFYLHSSQDQHGLWSLVERIKPPVALIHMEFEGRHPADPDASVPLAQHLRHRPPGDGR